MKELTLLIAIHPKSLKKIVEILKFIDRFGLDDNYDFDPDEIIYSDDIHFEKRWAKLNIPVDLFFEFEELCLRLRQEKRLKEFQNPVNNEN